MSRLPAHLLCWKNPQPVAVAVGITHPAAGATLSDDYPEGLLEGVPFDVAPPCTEVIASWQGRAPADSQIEIAVRAALAPSDAEAEAWTSWYVLGVWSETQRLRHSVVGQQDAHGTVYTDTLVLEAPTSRLQWRATLRRGETGAAPSLRSVLLSPSPVAQTPGVIPPHIAALAVPELPQMAFDGGNGWCSPTSLTMVLSYWATQTADPTLAPFTAPDAVPMLTVPGVHDPVYGGTGNWPFNTAFAASLGLQSYVTRLSGVGELAKWLASGVPVITSIRWKTGELDGAPVDHTDGHLVVVVGTTADGDLVVNDPAAGPTTGERVQRVYRREQFEHVWLDGSGGTVYMVYPPGHIDED